MITINLRPGLKRKTSGSPVEAIKDRLQALGGRVKDPLLVAAVVAWIAVGLGIGGLWLRQSRQLAELQPQLEQAQAEHRRFQSFIGQKRRQELIRDSLVKQIGVIRGVDGDRYVWAHVLDEVAKALPAYTWIVDMGVVAAAPASGPSSAGASTPPSAKGKDAADSADSAPPPVAFQITGRTVDIQAYTRFLRQLEASPWIAQVTPTSAQTVIEQNRPVTAFTIRATFQRADSAYIRTVPLSQSVR